MRPFFALALTAVAALGTCQTFYVGHAVKKALYDHAGGKRALEPKTGDPLAPRSGDLPAPTDGKQELKIVQAGSFNSRGGVTRGAGGCHFEYKGYDLYASEIEIDGKNDVGVLRGNVRVIGKEAVVNSGLVRINFKARTYEAEDGFAILRPSFVGGRVDGDLYTKGASSRGSQKEVHTHNGGLTTCDREHPHYVLESRDSVVRPGRRAILRNFRLDILGKTLLGLPYLSIPLEERSDRYLPEVGQSDEEGYFAKFKYPIALRGNDNFLDAKLDLMSKIGTGVGGTFDYSGKGRGSLRAYTLLGADRKTAEIVAQHDQRWGKLSVNASANYQRSNYLNSPENTSLNSLLRLGYGPTTLNYSRYSNVSSGFENIQQVLGLADNRTLYQSRGISGRLSLDLTYSNYDSKFTGGSGVQREQMDVRVRATHEAPVGTAELEYQRTVPFGTIQNFFGGTERTPVFNFRSDTRRLFGRKWSSSFPVTTEFSFGEFSNPADGRHISRMFFDVGGRLDPFQSENAKRGRFSLNLDGRLRQGVYSDDTAQYSTLFNAAATYRLGGQMRGVSPSLNFRYGFMDFHGFTPLDIDRSGKTDYATFDASFVPLRRFNLGVGTGYDFRQEQLQTTAWQTIGVRSEWEPVDGFKIRSMSTYDPFQKLWSNVRLDVPQFKLGSATISAGARYDGRRHVWGATNLFVDGIKMGNLTVSTLFAYNGYLKQFEARHFSFTYDLHCAEAVLQVLDNPIGFRSGRTVYFFVRVKALPFDTPFGLGRRGQSFGTGTGRDFF